MLTLAQAADRIGVASSTLRTQVHKGRLHARKIGTLWVVNERELARYQRDSVGRPGRKAHRDR